jgi:hypothetical protein
MLRAGRHPLEPVVPADEDVKCGARAERGDHAVDQRHQRAYDSSVPRRRHAVDATRPRAGPISVPYLPYFSNCREWDSYVVFHNLVESDRCELPPETTREGAFSDPTAPKLTPLRRYAYPPLPHYDDVQAVKFLDIALGFDKVPLAVLTQC